MSSSEMERNYSSQGFLLVLVLVALFSSPCHRRDEEMVPIGPDVKAELVVFFKTDATHDAIYKFTNETISTPSDRGSWPLPGIRMISHVLPINGHEGYAINFSSAATEAERKYVRSKIDASPIVYTVMENVAPADIKRVN